MNELEILNKLEKIRKEKGWSRYQLSKYAGITPSTLSNAIKRGTIPSIPTLNAFLEACNMTLAQFFDNEDKGSVRINNKELDLINNFRLLDNDLKEDVFKLIITLNKYKKV